MPAPVLLSLDPLHSLFNALCTLHAMCGHSLHNLVSGCVAGRAVVELTVQREGQPDPESVDPEAPITSKLRIVLDGYSGE